VRKSNKTEELTILELQTGKIDFHIVGLSPFLCNAVSAKAKGDLLLPRGYLTTADKSSNMKHDPVAEFRGSMYVHRSDHTGPTRLKFPAAAFKKALASAAIDIPGAKKAQIGRLVWTDWDDVDIYGIPELKMDIVRMADIGRTPDIRTRACLSRWACRVTMNFVKPIMNVKSLANLLAASGRIIGVGDGRQEKGTHNYGQFQIVANDDANYKAILKSGNRAAQDAAIANPKYYDLETERLHLWFKEELDKRGRKDDVSAVGTPKTRAAMGKCRR
jgi:hypothetical protein